MIFASRRFGLFYKFSISIILIVLLFGLINILIVRSSVHHSLDSEYTKRGVFLGKTIAEQALPHVLTNNIAELNKVINNVMSVDTTVYYAFILNKNKEVLAHSFSDYVPAELIDANNDIADKDYNYILIRKKSDEQFLVKDFVLPLLTKEVGVIRIGIVQGKTNPLINKTIIRLVFMILLFIILGILGAFLLSFIIVRPLKVLGIHSESIDIETINSGIAQIELSRNNLYFRLRRLLQTNDEIDVLYDKFILMLERLSQTYIKINSIQNSMIHAEKMASMGTFTAGIAHEINNPIAGIKNCLIRMKKNQNNPEKILEYTELMIDAVNKIEQVIQSLLSFSRKKDIEFKEEELCLIVQESINLSMLRYGKHNVKIEREPYDGNCIIQADSMRLQQVFTNIIFNAMDAIEDKIKVSPDHKGKIHIKFKKTGKEIMLTFKDNGTGIRKENLSSIFDPFYTTKEVGKGTGLGLSVAYQIINDHNGSIECESIYGEDTSFIIRFLLYQQAFS